MALDLTTESKAQLDALVAKFFGTASALSVGQKNDFLAALVSWRAQQTDATLLDLRQREVAAVEAAAVAQVDALNVQGHLAQSQLVLVNLQIAALHGTPPPVDTTPSWAQRLAAFFGLRPAGS